MTGDGQSGAPPPLPPKRRPPPATTGIAGDARHFEDLVRASSSASRTSLDSRWVYQREGRVFGPISAKELLELLYEGTLDFDASVAPDGGEFKPVRRFGVFRAHRERVERHRAQVRTATARARRERARLRRRIVGASLAAAVVLGVGGAGVRAWIRSSRRAEAERVKERAEARLRAEIARLSAGIRVEPPLTSLIDGEAADAGEPPSADRRRATDRRARRARPSRRRAAAAKAAARGPLTDGEILKGIGRALPSFKRCIVEQIQRDGSSIDDRIVLRFAIGNDGRARDFALADRFLRASPLQPCLGRQLGSVRWRAFRGEVRNVEYPIRIRRH